MTFQYSARHTVLIGSLFPIALSALAQNGHVRIRVLDQSGAQIPDAKVALLGGENQPTRLQKTNDAGVIVFADLPTGANRFRIARPGFESLTISITADRDSDVQQDAVLRVNMKDAIIDTVEPYIPPEQAKQTPAVNPKRKHWFIFWR